MAFGHRVRSATAALKPAIPPAIRICRCGCQKPVGFRRMYASAACYPSKAKPRYPDLPEFPKTRSAVDRGIPAPIVDVLTTLLDVKDEALTLDAILVRDLGADAVDIVEIGLALEERYGVTVEDEWLSEDESEESLTVGQIIRDLRKLGAAL